MGGQSEKKIQQNKAKVIGYYRYSTLLGSVVYILTNLWSGDLLTFNGALLALFVQFVSYFCYTSIEKSLDLGLTLDSYSLYLDVLVLNLIIEIGSAVSDYAIYLYSVFPLILLYKLLSLCWGWATNMEYVEDKATGKKKKKEKVKYAKN